MFDANNNMMMKEAKKAKFKPNFFLQILIFIGIMLLVQSLVSFILVIPIVIWMFAQPEFINACTTGDIAVAMELAYNMPDWILLVQLFATIIETILAVVYCRFIEKRSLLSMGFTKKGWLKDYLIGYVVGAVMITTAGMIAVAAGTMSLTLSASISVIYFILFFTGYIVQGMAEEVMVRGYFMISLTNSLKSRYAAAIAVGVSSIAFSLLHLGNPGITLLSIVNLTLAGVFFALYVLRTGNIWGACAAHTAWNFFQGNVLGVQVSGLTMNTSIFTATLSDKGSLINGGSFGLEGGLAVTIVEVVAIILLLVIPQFKKAADTDETACCH